MIKSLCRLRPSPPGLKGLGAMADEAATKAAMAKIESFILK